jgi:hypothetical protein
MDFSIFVDVKLGRRAYFTAATAVMTFPNFQK